MMAENGPPVFLITGPPGAGKSSVARSLMRRFPSSVHIPVDDLREWVVSGIAHPVPHWTVETSLQFALARRSAADVARNYVQSGYAVAIDDVISYPEARTYFIEPLSPSTVHAVLLRPRLDVTLARNADRSTKAFESEILVDAIRNLDGEFGDEIARGVGWIAIDNADLTVDGTVDEILRLTSASGS